MIIVAVTIQNEPLTDTCDVKWQQTRDGLVIASLLISFFGLMAMIILLVLVVVDAHLRKSKFCHSSVYICI